ncbi:hypothetical protein CAL18_16855 [Bordetella genomosp. 7]|uniref:DUF3306 domain-containing protein n=1 Tax=Bordetella TaxID=517 RepID=UPI0004AD8DA3|nr:MULTISPECIES: DUF3306 domain-containing protein [Bordetella]OZI16935.1 hypothetical protein CAL18_16855 [Bordetella genomosp. 7]
MNDAGHDGFLRRWARRKAKARAGTPEHDVPAPADPAQDAAPAEPAAPVEAAPGAPMAPEQHPADARQEPPALTLDDVRALTPDSDFSPFVSGQVAPEIKNAALKKLFADPHFNIMDGLDVYIDDYSAMEPMPASMLRRLASARALAMFDDDDEVDAAPGPRAGQAAAAPSDAQDAQPAIGPAGTQAEPDAPLQGGSEPSASSRSGEEGVQCPVPPAAGADPDVNR